MPAQGTAARTFGRRQATPQALYPSVIGASSERAPRKSVRIPATVTAEELQGSILCSVSNISASGALLRLPSDLSASHIYLPHTINLKLIHDRCEVACRIVYQDGLKVGVCFLAPFSPAKRA